MQKISTIDEYIKLFPSDVKNKLNLLRKTIHNIVPEAIETISYGMPTFKLKGNFAHFAAYKNHIGFYPTPSPIVAFEEELRQYKTSKGAIQFPLTKELPIDLITRILKYRVTQIQ